MKIIWKVLAIILTIFLNPPIVAAQTSKEKIELIKVHPVNERYFTQGFEVGKDENVYLATGLYGESKLGIIDFNTGLLETKLNLEKQYFGEGITITDEAIWQLTWKENTLFKWNINTYELEETFDYPGEGWGLTYDSDQKFFWMSDGSSKLFKHDIDTFERIQEIEVTYQGKAIDQLNELEYVEGTIYANIWYNNEIVAIDPLSGKVIATYDFAPIIQSLDLTEAQRKEMDSLNGIAHIEGDRFYITGKMFPFILEVELSSKE
ncbi:glutaminyl-peptide cyclotransferase [Facklamia sp. DSM 111018]|uniref:Glutaminyl-peptide cyclotransferase n=1 Tax=Facklamia lactis TaxID=2749967 RepID=A0ABS0LPB6_9LACT|nr:glutaminyl-peptide cyclotransferase [Facklamia lactis]MBG9980082.1 glutaminyl-peptide cyclotransferase [Facklamia lactis]MBG9985884.1 glutaminyl-peptide cyclotransferase [Facklamia lactis]